MVYLKYFFFGILAALSSLIIELLIDSFSLFVQINGNSSLLSFFLISATIEEFFKLLFIIRIWLETSSKPKVLTYSLMVGLGFSAIEIFFNSWRLMGQTLPFHLYFGLIFIHVLTAGIIGFFLSRQPKISWTVSVLTFLNILLHVGYNWAILAWVK